MASSRMILQLKFSHTLKQAFVNISTYKNDSVPWLKAHKWPSKQGSPRLSIRIVILILPSDILFGDDLYCICFDQPN